MKKLYSIILTKIIVIAASAVIAAIFYGIQSGNALNSKICLKDKHRPQIHFSPREFWMREPNGMVYYKGEYHLFHQYHPYSWRPLHWAHAVTKDLVHWTYLHVALFPDEHGSIFSGSAVVDVRNSSGFQVNESENVIVAMFTQHGDVQQQSIAYSNNRGRYFRKYKINPLILNSRIRNFRDPKVRAYNDKWIMVLTAGQKIEFFESVNLRSWKRVSEFRNDPFESDHARIWTCPELIPLECCGRRLWVLLISVSIGGPNFGSATQYFIGNFNGTTFTNLYPGESSFWLDHGDDNYGGVTFSNEPFDRSIMMGWMNNWFYADKVPTKKWRGQMTLPRILKIVSIDDKYHLASVPVPELLTLRNLDEVYEPIINPVPTNTIIILTENATFQNPLLEVDVKLKMTLALDEGTAFEICFYNTLDEEICFGYYHNIKSFLVDRAKSGNVTFLTNYRKQTIAPRKIELDSFSIKFFLDVSSLEIFADDGITVMTELFYPTEPFRFIKLSHSSLKPTSRLIVESIRIQGLYSMYNC